MLAYELLETETGNLMSSHDTEAQALRAVSERVRRFGPGSIASVALVQVDDEDEDGEMVLVAAGAELLARLDCGPSKGGEQGKSATEAAPTTAVTPPLGDAPRSRSA